MSQDVLLTVMNSMSLLGESVNVDGERKESCNLKAKLLKSQNAFNNLLKRYSQLENHCISLEASIQLNQEIFQKDESCNNQNALKILEFLKKNDLKAQLQDKDNTICKLKDKIKSMRKKSKDENVKYDYCETLKRLFCPKIPRQVFEDLPLEQGILSFIRDCGHTRDITYLTDVNVDYLHQPWRAFATVINKCLSGKETGMDKIHLLFQIEYNDAKKTNKVSYPRFTKIIIDYFMSKDPSISRRNKMFWHTARDDTLFTSIRCISKHKDTQVYGTILPTKLTNQAMLKSKAYQTYYAFASRKKAPKPKYIRKKADSDTSPKKKSVQATKGTRLKSKAKVALAEAEQIKLATKRSKKDFHVSHESGSGDGVDTQLKVPDEQQQMTSGTDEGTDSEDEDDTDDDGDNDDDGESDDHDDDKEDVDDIVRTPSDYELTDDEKLYDDVNVNLGKDDTEMTDADQGASEQQNVSKESEFEQEEEDAHVTLTPVLDAQKADEPVQSSSVSSNFTSKLLNLENPSLACNEIASLLETFAHNATAIPEITSGFTTTTPPPTPFFNTLI
ncbi:hypothetical protein Tco_1215409 [Tanacetum coccineum]